MQLMNEPRQSDEEFGNRPEREQQAVEQLVSHFHAVYEQAASILRQLLTIIPRDRSQPEEEEVTPPV